MSCLGGSAPHASSSENHLPHIRLLKPISRDDPPSPLGARGISGSGREKFADWRVWCREVILLICGDGTALGRPTQVCCTVAVRLWFRLSWAFREEMDGVLFAEVRADPSHQAGGCELCMVNHRLFSRNGTDVEKQSSICRRPQTSGNSTVTDLPSVENQ